mmetsp:Transcript_42495/g.48289  ORF Transcript_42495/g.48289 Transcript_42495/m.48289 type:complete len:201 (-) Transcript_42495:202-804(-)
MLFLLLDGKGNTEEGVGTTPLLLLFLFGRRGVRTRKPKDTTSSFCFRDTCPSNNSFATVRECARPTPSELFAFAFFEPNDESCTPSWKSRSSTCLVIKGAPGVALFRSVIVNSPSPIMGVVGEKVTVILGGSALMGLCLMALDIPFSRIIPINMGSISTHQSSLILSPTAPQAALSTKTMSLPSMQSRTSCRRHSFSGCN